MITSNDIFQIILDEEERDVLYAELDQILPQAIPVNMERFPMLYELRWEIHASRKNK